MCCPLGESLGNSYNLASDAVQGAYSVTLTSAPSPAIHVGDMVVIDENTDNDSNVVWGSKFWSARATARAAGSPPASKATANRQDRSLVQWLEVSAVNGATITFDTPLTYPYHAAYCGAIDSHSRADTFLHGAGIENLFRLGWHGRRRQWQYLDH